MIFIELKSMLLIRTIACINSNICYSNVKYYMDIKMLTRQDKTRQDKTRQDKTRQDTYLIYKLIIHHILKITTNVSI